jgi:hypothetical protein
MSVKGPVAELMRRVHDANADGRLGGVEARRVAMALVTKAARGVEIAVDGAPPEPGSVDVRLARTAPDLVAIGLVSLSRSLDASARRRLTVRVPAGTGPLRVQVQCLGSWRLASRSSPVVEDLAPGELLELWFENVLPDPAAAAGAGRRSRQP